MIRVLPGRDARAWAEVDAWARGIAADPALAPPGSSAPDRVQQPGRDDALTAWARAVDASRLSDRTAAAIEAYLRTYRHMAGPARAESALRLVDAVTAQVSPPPPMNQFPLDILATVLAARRAGAQAGGPGTNPAGR